MWSRRSSWWQQRHPGPPTPYSRCDHFFHTKRIDTNVYLVEYSTWSFFYVLIRKCSHCIEIFKIIVGYLAVVKRKFGEFAQRPLKGSPPRSMVRTFRGSFCVMTTAVSSDGLSRMFILVTQNNLRTLLIFTVWQVQIYYFILKKVRKIAIKWDFFFEKKNEKKCLIFNIKQ